jgi:hypothetical protein
MVNPYSDYRIGKAVYGTLDCGLDKTNLDSSHKAKVGLSSSLLSYYPI